MEDCACGFEWNQTGWYCWPGLFVLSSDLKATIFQRSIQDSHLYFTRISIVSILLQLRFELKRQVGGSEFLTGKWMVSLTKLCVTYFLLLPYCLYAFFTAAAVFFLSFLCSPLGQSLGCHLWGRLQISPYCYYINTQLSHLRNSFCSTSLSTDSCCYYDRSLYKNL